MRHGKLGIILQARMGSTRLPGKSLMPLAGKPMLQRIVERLQACRRSDLLVVATTSLEQDLPLAALAAELGAAAFRGSERDVLDRYLRCARHFGLEHIVRATGDNPFVDPEECDRLVDFYFTRQVDYATVSTEGADGYPVGVGVEIFGMHALERSWREGAAPQHREHVNEYILENPGMFSLARMPAPPEKCAPGLSLTVDTLSQYQEAAEAYSGYYDRHPAGPMPLPWVIGVYRQGMQHPGRIL